MCAEHEHLGLEAALAESVLTAGADMAVVTVVVDAAVAACPLEFVAAAVAEEDQLVV